MSSAQIISATAFQNKMSLQGLSRPAYPGAGGVSVPPASPPPETRTEGSWRWTNQGLHVVFFFSCSFGTALFLDNQGHLKSKEPLVASVCGCGMVCVSVLGRVCVWDGVCEWFRAC